MTVNRSISKIQSFTFGKEEKLCSKKIIDSLFESGKSIFNPPLRLTWTILVSETKSPAQIVFIIPKKHFRHAVDRNKIRRQMREIYRLHKDSLYNTCRLKNKQIALMLSFSGKIQLSYPELESKIILILHRLEETLQANGQ